VKYQLARGRDLTTRTAVAPSGIDDAPALSPKPPILEETTTSAPNPVGRAQLTLADISGREMLSTPVAVLRSGWFAFPTRPAVGAHAWHVVLPSGREAEVTGGILHDAGPVGVWQIPVPEDTGRMALAPWAPDRPLRWQAIDGPPDTQQVQILEFETLVDFIRIPLDAAADAPGLFIQDGRVVGWSFAPLIPGGYLWTGFTDTDLTAEFYIDDFYRLTFAGGREEALILALAETDFSDLQRLEALTAAYRLEPRLAAADTPGHLQPTAIGTAMRDLMRRVASLEGEALLALMEPATVVAVGNPAMAFDLLEIARDLEAYPYALELAAALQEADMGRPPPAVEIEAYQASIYHQWLNRLVADGATYDAQAVYREAAELFPRDPGIHLVGVELSLLAGDWGNADILLKSRAYPPEWRDTALRLAQDIAAQKAQAGKIVIRFRPGSRRIPISARLGRGLDQQFLIDTGATLTTIPSATARQLGLDKQAYQRPRRLFYSATGVFNAIEVTLPYIDLGGYVIEDIPALVVDLPGQPGVGLLGMNYLSNFRMDVNTADGLLMMAPR
jgi:clan AA aspartic protease (TIGR02281 family)